MKRSSLPGWITSLRACLACKYLILLGTLVLAGCAPLAAAPSAASDTPFAPTLTQTPTTTATIDWFPATPTPTQPATQPPVPTPEMRPGMGDLLFSDDFSDQKAWQTRKSSLGSVAYGKQELTLAIPEGKTSLLSLRSGLTLTDFYLEIESAPSLCRGTDNYGLLLRAQSEQDYYRFILTCDGELRLERVIGGEPAVIQDWIPRGSRPDATRLGVWAVGNEMRFFIDDIYQFSVHDPVFNSGSLGVFARSNGENALTVNFSNLSVRAVDPSAVQSTPPAPTHTPQPYSEYRSARALIAISIPRSRL